MSHLEKDFINVNTSKRHVQTIFFTHLISLKSNFRNGTLDKPEVVSPTPIVIIEGLHPMYDKRVRNLIDFSLYLDISDEVKLNWKIQVRSNFKMKEMR